MSKLSYQCGWKSISLNEQKNQTISTRHLLLTWIMGKQTCLLLREVVSLSSKLQRKSNQNPITVYLLGKSVTHTIFSKANNVGRQQYTSRIPQCIWPRLGVEGEGAELRARGSPWLQSPLGTAEPFPRLCQTHHFL